MKKTIITSLLVLALLPAAAQKLQVIKSTIDVGKTGYQQPVTAVFEFKNKSLRRLKIEAVKPDCECTKVEFPTKEIGMNDKFEIKMTYDARQLGHFDKQAAIVSNGSKKPVYIRMKGIVLPEVLDFSSSYPIELGDLRIDRDQLEFDDVNKGDNPVQEIHLYNNGTRVYHPNLMHLPPYLSAKVSPETLAPAHAGIITVTLNSENIHDYGLTQTSVYLAGNPGDKVSQDNAIGVSAVLLPAFTNMTAEQRNYSPHIQLSKETIDIDFQGKAKKTDVIDITNQGQTALKISSLQMFTPGLKVTLGKRQLNPGESTKLKITVERDELKKARTRPRVLMITNDPAKAKVVININTK